MRYSRIKWLGHKRRKNGKGTPGYEMQGRRGREKPKETWVRTRRNKTEQNV